MRRPLFFTQGRIGHKVARFRQVNKSQSNVHHDALEFPDGQIVLLTQLCEGQHATVLQLPAGPRVTTGEDAAGLARRLTPRRYLGRPTTKSLDLLRVVVA